MELLSMHDGMTSFTQDIPADYQDNSNFNRNIIQKRITNYRSPTISRKRYCFFQLKQFLLIPYVAFAIFTSIVITIGVLVVCLTAHEKQVGTCPTTYKVLITDIDNRDSSPQYVVVGDVNNDRKLDVVVVTTGIDSVKILLGQRNGSFVNGITLQTGPGSQPYSAALGHFNNDRCLDLVVANYGAHNMGIFLGNCHGNFQNQSACTTGVSQPIIVTVGDVNNDNHSDLIVTNNGTDSIAVFLGHGDGTFTNPVRYSTGFDSFPYDVTVGDIDDDGQLDIIVTNYGTDNVGIHLGYGNGTFAPQKFYSTGFGSRPYSIALSHWNQDNKLDLIIANSGTGNIALFLGYGNGTFGHKTTFFTDIYGSVQLVIGNMNNDHRKDVFIVSTWNNNVYVLLGGDNATFTDKIAFSTNLDSQPRSIAVGDVNNDNRTDVIVANYGTNNVGVLLGYDPGLFRNQTTYPTVNGSGPYSATLGDVNNDNMVDIIVIHPPTGYMGVFLGHGDGAFTAELIYSTGSGSEPYAVAIGDFNNDNRSDIVVANSGTNNIGIFLGYGNGSFQKQKKFSTGRTSAPNSVAVGDFNDDNHLDIVVVNLKTANVGLFLGYGNGSFAAQRIFSTGNSSGPFWIVVADFNNDRRLDIAVANYVAGTVGIFLGYGTGNFTDQTTYSCNFNPPQFIAVGDMNNDNHLDLIIATKNDFYQTVGLFLGVGDGTFETPMRYPAGGDSSPYGLSIGDLNNDTYQDIVLANANPNNIGILFGYGDGTFASQQTYSTGDNSFPTMIAVADLNHDNRLDIVVTNYFGCNIGIFLGYVYGALARPRTYSTGSSTKPQSVKFGAFNHDDELGIVVANHGTNTVGVYMKSTNWTFANEILYQTGADSLPNSVILADFNKDSEMDIAVVNSGNDSIGLFLGYGNGSFEIGSFYSTGSGTQPCAIAAGDLNNDTWMDIIVGNYAASSIGVFLGYKYPNHRNQMTYPTGINSYPSFTSIGDLNNDNNTDVVIINTQTGSIGVFLGHGDGTFATQITHPIDLTFQPCATTIADFNNDNRADVVICFQMNSIGIFLGYGNGTLTSLRIYSIGNQSIPSDVYAADFNNDNHMDLVIVADSENDHVIVLFGRGDGTFVNQTNYSAGLNAGQLSVSVADFNNDHHLDIVITNVVDDNIGIFLGYGNGSFAAQKTYSTGVNSAPKSISVGDLNNDNHLDIVITNYDTVNIGIFFGYGNGSFANQKTYSLAVSDQFAPSSTAIGDFNNDNLLDIVVTSYQDEKIVLFLGYGNDVFEILRLYDTGFQSAPDGIVVTDLNHDHVLDIIVANGGTGNIGVFIGTCCEMFLHQRTFPTGSTSGSHSVAVDDFNADGILDVVVANELAGNIGILLGHGKGNFGKQTAYPTGLGSRPYSVAVGKLNNDTHLDIAVSNYGNGTIGVLFGHGNGAFGNYTTYSTGVGSRPNAVAVLDLNNDTRLDIAITNDGTNNIAILFGYGNGSFGALTIYQTGYNTRPCAIATGDYNNDNETDIIVTECGSNSIGIIAKFC